MARSLIDGRGAPVSLGREIGRGGEGAVYEVANAAGLAAKLYHERVEPEKVDKLTAMARLANSELLRVAAWPTGTLHETRVGALVGIMLPKVTDHREIHQLYSPIQRKLHYPKADWEFLFHVAMNCAAAFETIHGYGHVIGDVNQGGVLVSDRGTIHLIDCDSFQIQDGNRLYPCVVGVPQYTPPELQRRSSFRDFYRTPSHDCFGLALLVFHLLFMGRHPFAGKYSGSGDMTIERAISEGRFAFSRHAVQYQMATPPHAVALSSVTPQLAGMFERAFARVNGATVSRPSAAEWREALLAAKATLTKCPTDPSHRFPRHLQDCPWCHIEEAGGPAFFVSSTGVTSFDAGFDLLAAWAKIQRVPAPPGPDALVIPRSPSNLRPAPLPQGVDYERLGPPQPIPHEPLLLLEELPEFPPEPLPEEVPAEPPLRLEAQPVLKDWEQPDFRAAAKRLYERSLDFPDYRQVKWGTFATAVVTAGTFKWPAVAAVSGVLVLMLGLTWMFYFVPRWRKYRRALIEADCLSEAARRKRERQEEHHKYLCRQVDETNVLRRSEWERRVAQLNETREGAPARNAARREAWLIRVGEIRRARDEIRRRNEAARSAHLEAVRRFEAERQEAERINASIASAKARHARERQARAAAVQSARARLADVRQSWAEKSDSYRREYNVAHALLGNAKSDYEAMAEAYNRDLERLRNNSEASQRTAYLRGYLIEDASIKGVGAGRKATLAAYGIETADDVHQVDLQEVPGFGATLMGEMLAWKRDVLKGFIYNPNKKISPSDLRALQMHYHGHKQTLQRTLLGGDEKLQGITARGNRELADFTRRAEQYVREVAQAEADLTVY